MEANKQLVINQWLSTLALGGSALAALTVFVFVSPSSLCMPSHYSNLPAIKAHCIHYLRSMWTLLVYREEAPLMTSRNLFLLINLIIFLIISSLHLQQQAIAASAARKARKKRRPSQTEKLDIDRNISLQPLHVSMISSIDEKDDAVAAATATPSDAGLTSPQTSMETSVDCLSASAISYLQVQSRACVEELSSNEEHDAARSAPMETLPAQYYAVSPPAVDNEPSWTLGPPIATVERIILEEDGRLKLIDRADGSDVQKIERGRLRWTDRRLPKASRRKARNYHNGSSYPRSYPTDDCARSSWETTSNGFDSQCEQYTYPHHKNSYLATQKCESSQGHIVPKSISLNSNNLLNSDHQSRDTTFSRSRVKSMDVTNDSTIGNQMSWQTGRKKRGNHNVVKRAFGVRRVPSIGSQELNARVESFIAEFNEKIKIQRQESLLSYMQMVDRGA